MYRILQLCFYLILVHYVSNILTLLDNFIGKNKTYHPNDHESFQIKTNLMEFTHKDSYKVNDTNMVPTDTLQGIYLECILGLSFSCLQKKLIAFLCKLDTMKSIQVIGKSVQLVRKKNVPSDIMILAKAAEHVDSEYLMDIIDNLIDKFFDTHSLRLKVPHYLDDPKDREDETYLDIDFETKHLSSGRRESRRKKRRPNMRGMKKIMMMIGLMTCMKLIMLGPLSIGLLGLKAMKALIFAVVSLTISKMLLLGKVDVHSLFSGHDWYSSAGHSNTWDRNIQDPQPPSSIIPENIEPPRIHDD